MKENVKKNTFPSCLYPVLLELDPYTELQKEREKLTCYFYFLLLNYGLTALNTQQLAGCIIYVLYFQNATAELKRKWDWFLSFLEMFFKKLFCSFHLSGGWKEHFEFLKSVMGIILCILDVDTVINKSKPEIAITNHVVVFTIKTSLRISPALLTSEIFVLSFMLFTHSSNRTLWSRHKLHLRTDTQREREGTDFLKYYSEGQLQSTAYFPALPHQEAFCHGRGSNFWH